METFKILIKEGVDVNSKVIWQIGKEDYCETVLHMAARFRRTDVMEYLLSQGANANVEGEILNCKGTALDFYVAGVIGKCSSSMIQTLKDKIGRCHCKISFIPRPHDV